MEEEFWCKWFNLHSVLWLFSGFSSCVFCSFGPPILRMESCSKSSGGQRGSGIHTPQGTGQASLFSYPLSIGSLPRKTECAANCKVCKAHTLFCHLFSYPVGSIWHIVIAPVLSEHALHANISGLDGFFKRQVVPQMDIMLA